MKSILENSDNISSNMANIDMNNDSMMADMSENAEAISTNMEKIEMNSVTL